MQRVKTSEFKEFKVGCGRDQILLIEGFNPQGKAGIGQQATTGRGQVVSDLKLLRQSHLWFAAPAAEIKKFIAVDQSGILSPGGGQEFGT